MIVLVSFIAGAVLVLLMDRPTIDDLRAQNRQLYRDNQALTEALTRANGQPVYFEPPKVGDAVANPVPRQHPAPYWQPKQERTVQIGEKTVTLKS